MLVGLDSDLVLLTKLEKNDWIWILVVLVLVPLCCACAAHFVLVLKRAPVAHLGPASGQQGGAFVVLLCGVPLCFVDFC